MSAVAKRRAGLKKVKRACRLCGNTRKLIKTPCCDHWICNDERNYIPFDYYSSCFRNHRRYTFCAFHHTEGHAGKWQECSECKEECSGVDFDDNANGMFCIEKLEDYNKIICVVCGFKSESKEDFAFQLEEDYYCTKDECQKVGKPPPRQRKKRTPGVSNAKKTVAKRVKKACSLCGKNRKLTKTECCDYWICDDEHKYRPFSYSFDSCHRNHRRYTFCGFHHTEGHAGKWQECSECKEDCSGVDFDDNANGMFCIEKLEDYNKITCVVCGYKSESKEDFPIQLGDDYYCTKDECQKVSNSPTSVKRRSVMKKASNTVAKKVKKACGLCGETKKLLETDCCNNWVCNSINKCYMSHNKYTLCAYHYNESHEGKWQECIECHKEFSDIDFDDFANGFYNFVKLSDYPKITRTCAVCGLKSETLKDFAFKLKDEFYCTKDECQNKGKPSQSNDSIPKLESEKDLPIQLDDDNYSTNDEDQKFGKSPSRTKRKSVRNKVSKAVVKKVKNACGLCGETKKLLLTDCCNNWACTGINKCHMSHNKYTLCAYHSNESHKGKWQECFECHKEFTAIDFNDFANGSWNFEKLRDYPKIKRICEVCGFKSETLKDFAFKINNEFYCDKYECHQRGKLLKSNDKANSESKNNLAVQVKDECLHRGKLYTSSDLSNSESKENFAVQVKDEYSCNDECQIVGSKPPSCKRTVVKAETSKVNVTLKKAKIACGLCGETEKLMKTECCDNWICVNKCLLSHRKYTLCSHHHIKRHLGRWQNCVNCKKEFSKGDYNDFANGNFNFVKLKKGSKITDFFSKISI